MGMKSNSGHFKGTNGTKKLVNFSLQLFAELPKNESQLKHIFRNSNGHLSDSSENRSLMTSLSSDKSSFLGKDKNGVEWYAKTLGTKQIWVSVKNGIIQNGGINEVPISFVENEGLKRKKIIRRKK